jgi:c-di-GMP-binding flagellar brake protein YcgR
MRLWLSSDSPVTQLEQAKRKSDRTYFYDDERVFCEFQNPHDDQTTLRKRVLDISKSGLGLLTHGNSKLFVPGLKMRDLRIFGDIEADITCDAEVRYSRKYISLNKESCNQVGLEIKVKKS